MSENPNKLNLDQLLAAKRAEKPSEDFWAGFQTEFRQRQLQTLMKKESSWSRYTTRFFASPGILVPFSAAAAAVFVLVLNFQENAPLQTQYYDAASLIQTAPAPEFVEVALEFPEIEVVPAHSTPDQASGIASSASFVMDLIPNEEPESLSYIREFPTSTIPAENRVVSALVSYTIAHDAPAFGVTGRTQTFGF